jgi:hypothetical protein
MACYVPAPNTDAAPVPVPCGLLSSGLQEWGRLNVQIFDFIVGV